MGDEGAIDPRPPGARCLVTAGAKVVLVAVPLMARSGIYRSTHDLVRAASAAGYQWSALLGMRPDAAGEPVTTPGVREFTFRERGRAGQRAIRQLLAEAPEVRQADVVVSLISQSDVALARMGRSLQKPWIAWVRGKPWPAAGEQSAIRRVVLRRMETRALRAADDVWATTPVLAAEFATARAATIVPAGIGAVERVADGSNGEGPLVWAGRLDVDKRPELLLDIAEAVGHRARMHGTGPLRDALLARRSHVELPGWTAAGDLWRGASIFIGTSSREAFGRSAVEAAAAGLPLILADAYGAAPLLFTDESLRAVCVIDGSDPARWAAAVSRLLDDPGLRQEVSRHVHANAQTLTIEGSVRSAVRRINDVLTGVHS